MKFGIVILLLSGVVFWQCNKRIKDAKMHMSDPVPDIRLTSVSGYTSNPMCYYPLPMDSSASAELDVDGNGSKDFKVETSHSSDLNSNCESSHCYCVKYISSVTALNGDGGVFVTGDNGESGVAKQLQSGDEIEKRGGYAKTGILFSTGQGGCEVCASFSAYVGIKMAKRYGWIKLSVHRDSIVIDRYGLSGVNNKLLKAGEE